MSTIKTLGAGLSVAVLLIVFILAVVALGSIIGGLVGAGIAAGYNVLFGTTFSVWKFALIGSIVGVVGGGASASSD